MKVKNEFLKLKNKISKKTATIAIIGQGYVGLPSSILYSQNNFKVMGYDLDKNLIKKLNKSNNDINGVKVNQIKKFLKKNFFFSDFRKVINADIYIICLPTPLKNLKPNLSYIDNFIKLISKEDLKGKLIILESTSYPSTTREKIEKKLSKKYLVVGKHYFVGYSPERISPGQKEKLEQIPKLYCGVSKNCTILIKELYRKIFKKIVKTNTIEVAETSKIFENIFRAVNIALVNEMKMICNKMKIDIFDVIKAASTKPFGFMPFSPGPGWGGHCIPIDPFYMSWIAKKYKINANFINLAGKINTMMPKYIISLLNKILKKNYKRKILIIGVAYKENISDTRESPAIKIIEQLKKNKKYKVDYHDPHVPLLKGLKLKNINLNAKKVRDYDCLIITTSHKGINWELIKKNSKSIIDTRGKIYKDSDRFILG